MPSAHIPQCRPRNKLKPIRRAEPSANGHAPRTPGEESELVAYLRSIDFDFSKVVTVGDEPPCITIAAPGEPASDRLKDLTALSTILDFLRHDGPERRALLKAAGLGQDSIAGRHLKYLADAISRARDSAASELKGSWSDCPYPDRHEYPVAGINAVRLSEIAERPVDWLWHQRLPLGKLTILAGDPGLGKTFLACDLVARITTGRPMPDGTPAFQGCRHEALWVSAEDDDADTTLPRIRMLGGDCTRVHSLQFVVDAGAERSLDLNAHLEHLDGWLAEHAAVRLAVLDPLSAFLGRIDTHRNSDVRGLLSPLSKLAARRRVALLALTHLAKGDGTTAAYRSIGSVAFIAAARSAWLVSKDAKDHDRRILTCIKSNHQSESVGGLAFRIGPAWTGIAWEKGQIDVTADQAPAALNQTKQKETGREKAEAWLRTRMKPGEWYPAKELEKEAKALGFNVHGTLQQAREALGIVKPENVRKVDKGWEWRLPQDST